MTCNHALDEFNICVYRCDAALRALLPAHICAGDNCVCIGGDENKDIVELDYCYEDAMTDGEADADALASAGWGTDEDYGCYGGED